MPVKSAKYGLLLAWVPVKQKAAWKVDHIGPFNGGTSSTAGNLVFQGTADGRFLAYNAANGDKLWEAEVGTGVIAAPVTYEVDGQQYVSIAAGWGGTYGLTAHHSKNQSPGRIYTFSLNSKTPMPEFTKTAPKPILSGIAYKPEDIATGAKLYLSHCIVCHGVPAVENGGAIPNLGYSDKIKIENLQAFVLTGALKELGMPNFDGKLTEHDVPKIQAFILASADAVSAQLAASK